MTTTADSDTDRDPRGLQTSTHSPRMQGLTGLVVAGFLDRVWPVVRPLITPVLLLSAWAGVAPVLWAMLSTLADQENGGYLVFFLVGTLWFLARLLSAVLGVRRPVHVVAANVPPAAALFRRSDLAPANGIAFGTIGRRARHEAAHAVVAWALGRR